MKYFIKNKKMSQKGNLQKANNFCAGFTIIEMMVAITVFTIVITIGIGSLLNAYKVHNKTQALRSIMDNLSFIMEDMSKSIRTGSEYKCDGGTDCTKGKELKFVDQYGRNIIYNIESDQTILKTNNDSGEKMVLNDNSQIQISPDESSFTVVGADPVPGDLRQPFVTIVLAGHIFSKGNIVPFSLQTSVSQRMLDTTKNGASGAGSGGNTLPYGANLCAQDGEKCIFDAPGTLYYGSDSSFYYSIQMTDSGAATCSPEVFSLEQKILGASCYFEIEGSSPNTFPMCSPKGDKCTNKSKDPGTMFYGNDKVFYAIQINSDKEIVCEPDSFGVDVKSIENASCYLELNNSSYGIPTLCPTDNLPELCSKKDEDCKYEQSGTVFFGRPDPKDAFCRAVSGQGIIPCIIDVFGSPFQNPDEIEGCFYIKN